MEGEGRIAVACAWSSRSIMQEKKLLAGAVTAGQLVSSCIVRVVYKPQLYLDGGVPTGTIP